MTTKEKSLYDYKVGEVIKKDLMNGLLKAPVKVVKIAYTFQDKDKTQMETAIVHNDFIGEKDDDD